MGRHAATGLFSSCMVLDLPMMCHKARSSAMWRDVVMIGSHPTLGLIRSFTTCTLITLVD